MKIVSISIDCVDEEIISVDNIMEYNGYKPTSRFSPYPKIDATMRRTKYVKVENKLDDFENIFDF